PRTSVRTRRIVSFLIVVLALVAAWESYKVIGKALDGTFPFSDQPLPVRPDDRTMPHTWDIIWALFQPVRRGGELLIVNLTKASLFTLSEALLGFVFGGLFGFALGVLFVRSQLAERAFMPYVVGSQTIPIIAIAPMVVVWGARLGLGQIFQIAIIAAYITFFPVVINTLRGLRSPEPTATELMRSYAASDRAMLWKLQVPAAMPYIFTALKVSATACVVGAIIGELPTGSRNGLGRALLEFSQQFGARPEKLYAAVLMSAVAGILFVGAITLIEFKLVQSRRRPV
ncbi:MAG: ABC transporter permease, partial [Acidimicrobiia bacterium]